VAVLRGGASPDRYALNSKNTGGRDVDTQLSDELLDRFEEKIERLPECGCWIWTGALQGRDYKNGGGYGSFRVSRESNGVRPAHIVSYEHHNGPVPEGAHLDHLCRIRQCVNPDHLDPVTPIENYRRGVGNKGENMSERTHCNHGHEFTPENTIMSKDSKSGRMYRRCRACRKEQRKKRG